jgi:hypothetical protein
MDCEVQFCTSEKIGEGLKRGSGITDDDREIRIDEQEV